MILLIDNYDSFVYNLSRYLVELGCETTVIRNDAATVADIRSLQPKAIVLSPGPCTPQEAGISVDLVRELGGSVPLLGVCLGHQSIAAAYGGRIVRAPQPIHGKTSRISHHQRRLFANLPHPLTATRYHSLVVDESQLPADLSVTARSADGLVMAVEHRRLPVFGVQFHPESVLTSCGHQLLGNFLEIAQISFSDPADGDFKQPERPADWQSASLQDGSPLHW